MSSGREVPSKMAPGSSHQSQRSVLLLGGLLLASVATEAAAPSLAGIYSFTGTAGDGANPYTGVILSSSGALFGTTEYGGTAGYGSVFELTPPTGGSGAWTETVIHS